jgi:NTE family protein
VAGISIGAINSALIASNPPEKRVERLREFWALVTANPGWGSLDGIGPTMVRGDMAHATFSQFAATNALTSQSLVVSHRWFMQ